MEKTHNIDRKAASKLLKVSLRTLDRYVKDKKLSTRIIGGRVWLNKEEIHQFKIGKEKTASIDKVDMSTDSLSIDNTVDSGVDNIDKVEIINLPENGGNSHIPKTEAKRKGENIYKKLFEDVKQELSESRERLEIANYRVGQLEAQLRNSIPLLEYHRENYEKSKKEAQLKTELDEKENLLEKLTSRLTYEKFNKRMFLVILLIILALQPLWLLLVMGE